MDCHRRPVFAADAVIGAGILRGMLRRVVYFGRPHGMPLRFACSVVSLFYAIAGEHAP